MKKTEHLLKRMNQRGISFQILELIYKFGLKQGDKLILNKKSTQKIIDEIDLIRKNLLKISDKGGVVLVLDNKTLITAYDIHK